MFREMIDGFVAAIFIVFAITLLFVIPVFLYGSSFETRYFPVYKNVEVIGIINVGDDLIYSLKMQKSRNCISLPNTNAWYITTIFDKQERVDMQVTPASTTENITKVDIVKVNNSKNYQIKSQKVVFTHYCHPLWVTETIINIPTSGVNNG